MNITRRWKRLVAFGCTHGVNIDPVAKAAILKMIQGYKPHTIVNGGDFLDTTAFRSGAKGTADESEPVEPDLKEGIEFLHEARCTHVLGGNHEDRLWRLQSSPNAIVSFCASQAITRIHEACRKLKAPFHPWGGAFQEPFIFGGTKFIHGYMYNENAARDHAESHGNVVHWHTHRPAIATGRRDDHPVGICPGSMTRRRNMDYAKARRQTLAWGQAILWGEYCDSAAAFNLCLGPSEQAEASKWILPV